MPAPFSEPALCSTPARWLALLVACLVLPACAARRVEETVTVDAHRLSALPAPAVAAATPQLPARDEDIEAAGDYIAEAITSLSRRHAPNAARNPAAAQRALEEAAAALTRALGNKPHDEPVRAALRTALRDVNNSQTAIKRNAYAEAVNQLTALNQRLDTLHGAENSKL
jgi:plasmid stabilization system protein ParE